MDGHPTGIECCGRRFDHGSEPPAGRHVKAPRSRAMLLHRGFEGPCPRAVLVDDRGFSGPGERECEVAVSSLRALREYAVDLESSLDHRRVGEWRNAVDRQDPGEHASFDRPATSWTVAARRHGIRTGPLPTRGSALRPT